MSCRNWVPGKRPPLKQKELLTSPSNHLCQNSGQFVAVHIYTKTDIIKQINYKRFPWGKETRVWVGK
jgi:hypothetical protein